jgi:hypothetical protein
MINTLNKIIILTALLFFSHCKAEDSPMKIFTYVNGVKSEVQLKSEQNNRVNQILSDLLIKTDDLLRVHFDDERIVEIKSIEKCIEIIFDKEKIFNTGFFGETSIKKVLIPLSGDFQASEKIDIVTVIIGVEEYSSSPLTASGGFKLIQELEALLFSK